jgi:hypothetical protein
MATTPTFRAVLRLRLPASGNLTCHAPVSAAGLHAGRGATAQGRACSHFRALRERIPVRRLSAYLWPLRSAVTWGKGGAHSGYRQLADKDEAGGSSPPRPTTGPNQRKRWPACPELIGRGGCRIKNSYLITAPGHEPDLQSNCCSRALVVQEGSEQTVYLCHCRRRAARGGQPQSACAGLASSTLSSHGSALVMLGEHGRWLAARSAVAHVRLDPVLVAVARRTTACWSRLGGVCAFGWGGHGRSRT